VGIYTKLYLEKVARELSDAERVASTAALGIGTGGVGGLLGYLPGRALRKDLKTLASTAARLGFVQQANTIDKLLGRAKVKAFRRALGVGGAAGLGGLLAGYLATKNDSTS